MGQIIVGKEILQVFTEVIEGKFREIWTDQEAMQALLGNVKNRIPQVANEVLSAPITKEELHIAVQGGKKLKAPGPDGVSGDFSPNAWDIVHETLLEVINTM